MSLKNSSRLFLAGMLIAIPVHQTRAQNSCQPDLLMGGVQFSYDQFGRPLVPVSLNGIAKLLVFDTGGFVDSIDRATALELGLRFNEAEIGMVDIAGNVSSTTVRIERMQVGNLVYADHEFMIEPGEPGAGETDDSAGLLVPSALINYDIEIDFDNNLLLLFSQERCGDTVVHWPAAVVAEIPFTLDSSYHIAFPVTVDGVELNAVIDTGASSTVMSLQVAERFFGAATDSPDLEQVGTLEGNYEAAIYQRSFERLEFGGVTIVKPTMTLLPNMMRQIGSTRPRLGTLFTDRDAEPSLPDVIIGMSVLRELHLYIAYGEKVLYVTPAAP